MSFNKIDKREGPLFNENVVGEGGRLFRVEGDMQRASLYDENGRLLNRGRVSLEATNEAGRPRRTFVYRSGDKEYYFGEQALSAGNTGIGCR